GIMNSRLEYYRKNCAKIPFIAGDVIPEPILSIEEYHTKLLSRAYRDISVYDPEGLLQHEFLNSRGAIARFDRNAIEIRVLDLQECPLADLAVASLISKVLKAVVEERWCPFQQQLYPQGKLVAIFRSIIPAAEETIIDDEAYLRCFGLQKKSCTAKELWSYLLAQVYVEKEFIEPLQLILTKGTLARRILKAVEKEELRKVYAKLCDCLAEGKMFV
ncbi:MAG: glutamate--cysteine ligase, partial [Nanoarchaeota archaeon]